MNPQKTALITGATSGFGWELCKLFASDHHNLILVARNKDKLMSCAQSLRNDFPDIEVNQFSIDLAQQGAAGALYEKIDMHKLEVDFLVNDAGVGEHGLFVENEMQKELDMINLNIVAVMELTKLFLREMVLKGEGRILQVSSALGLVPVPRFAVYSASKAFVHFLTEALQEEIKDTGVTMTALYPGGSDTDFFRRANAEETIFYQNIPLYTPEEVAIAGYEGLMEGKKRVVPGIMNKIQAASSSLVPDSLLMKALNKLMEEEVK